MAAPRSVFLAVASVVVVFAGCRSPAPPYPWIEPDAYEHEWRDFETTYDELRTAISATPDWETDRTSFVKVRGQATLVLKELEQLRPFSSHHQISIGAIEIAKVHVTDLARLGGGVPPTFVAHPEPYAAETLRYVAEQRAYQEIARVLPWLELYVADGVPNAWLERHVLVVSRSEGRRVLGIDATTRRFWSMAMMSPSDDEFEEVRARLRPVLDGLEKTAAAGAAERFTPEAGVAEPVIGN